MMRDFGLPGWIVLVLFAFIIGFNLALFVGAVLGVFWLAGEVL